MISAFLLGLCFGAGAYALASVHDYNIKERRLKQMNKKHTFYVSCFIDYVKKTNLKMRFGTL